MSIERGEEKDFGYYTKHALRGLGAAVAVPFALLNLWLNPRIREEDEREDPRFRTQSWKPKPESQFGWLFRNRGRGE
jgi:hypothetical protein